ncbi:perlucin [Penaeus vannamei]|uniref:perlucin n=1 Tax=Penaeus vannamei TaxID=6689 RepID=UPI00387F5283
MLHCSLLCESDIYCKGFCYSSSQLLCRISSSDVGKAGRNAVATPGFNMFWTGYVKGFRRYGEKAYRHFASSRTHWDARNLCWNMNASLAVPLNAGENSFLASLVNTGSFWILADDATAEGVWENTDTNERLSYGRWRAGQPDNGGGVEDCAELSYLAEWNDIACSQTRYYACEIPVAQCDRRRDDIRCSYLL